MNLWTGYAVCNNAVLFEEYLNRYPQGSFTVIAKARLAALNEVEKNAEVDTESILEKNEPPTPATAEAANGKPDEVELASAGEVGFGGPLVAAGVVTADSIGPQAAAKISSQGTKYAIRIHFIFKLLFTTLVFNVILMQLIFQRCPGTTWG